jgi:hypothetical protein
MSIKTNRAIAAAAAASIALTAFGLTPAAAAPRASEVSYRHDGGAAAHAGRVYLTASLPFIADTSGLEPRSMGIATGIWQARR